DGLGAPIRVLGSLGVSLHCPDSAGLLPSFDRTYADIDFAGYRRDTGAVSTFLTSLGYVEDREVAITSEGRRGLFDHATNGIHVDVFFDRLEFCHQIPLHGRLERDRPTIPLAELLLSKLQIVKINEKDVVDIILLLLDHELASGDEGTIDVGRVARMCAADWGLWRTTTMNLEKVSTLARTYPQLDVPRRERVGRQVVALVARIEAEPKSFGWRARARIGERVQWWTDVDEVR
ncbi:MAG: hypothetical protein ACRDFR_07095, partial [Candidatus Limnocylindria bacterium]